MNTAFFDKLLPDNPSWSLIEHHRAHYFILISTLLAVYYLFSFSFWFFVGEKVTAVTLLVVALVLLSISVPYGWLRYKKSIQQSVFILLTILFCLYNLTISVSGFHHSPMMLNLFYIPLIALLPGEAKTAIIWAVISIVSVSLHFIIGNSTDMQVVSDFFRNEAWYRWNLFCCVGITGILSLSYQKTVSTMMDILKEERQENKIESMKDNLTGLANQNMLNEFYNKVVYRSERLEQSILVFAINIRNFNYINGEYGYHTGDEILQILSKRLKSSVRSSDLVSRLKDDIFIVVLPNVPNDLSEELIIEKIKAVLSETVITRKHELELEFSFDFASYPQDGKSLSELLQKVVKSNASDQKQKDYSFA